MVIEYRYWLINGTRHVWHNQLPYCIIGFKKYLAVSEEFTIHEFSSLHRLPQKVLENTVYKLEDLGGTSCKMTILNIRSLASLATKNDDLKYKVTRFARDNN